jgi:hypothetical protein
MGRLSGNATGFCCSCGRLMLRQITIPRPQRPQQPGLARTPADAAIDPSATPRHVDAQRVPARQ